MADYYRRTICRVCKNRALEPILHLGKMPLANAFINKQDLRKKEGKYPLGIGFCKRCSLIQLSHVVNARILFADYHYLTSASRPLAEHFEHMADKLAKIHALKKNDLVVEIGSNDGVLLSRLLPWSRVLGIDPAKPAAKIAEKKGVETIMRFFSKKVAENVLKKYGAAKLIIANNVFAHIDDLDDIMRGVAKLLREDGAFVFEVNWVGNLIGKGGFDQIYHEHMSYYSLHALVHLAHRFGMEATDVELVPTHGESLRVTFQKNARPSSRIKKMLVREKKLGLHSIAEYRRFARKVQQGKLKLQKLLNTLKKKGAIITGYGAPAKGNTLLNYAGITTKHLDFITDTTPLKQGLYTPGTYIPIVKPEEMQRRHPNYVLLLSWNYAVQIMEKEKELRKKGTKFIIPVPNLRIR